MGNTLLVSSSGRTATLGRRPLTQLPGQTESAGTTVNAI